MTDAGCRMPSTGRPRGENGKAPRHRDGVTALQQALAVAQGDNLALRRKLSAYE